MRGKSYAVPMKLFNNWLVTNFNPLPEGEVQALMWHSWLECSKVMTATRKTNKELVEAWYDES